MLPPVLVINLALESRNTKQPQSSVITQFVSKPFCYHFSMIKGDISTPNRTVLWARITLMLSSLHSIYIKSVHLVHKYISFCFTTTQAHDIFFYLIHSSIHILSSENSFSSFEFDKDPHSIIWIPIKKESQINNFPASLTAILTATNSSNKD